MGLEQELIRMSQKLNNFLVWVNDYGVPLHPKALHLGNALHLSYALFSNNSTDQRQ